jgi:7-cyano-7-deazaguanine reductase
MPKKPAKKKTAAHSPHPALECFPNPHPGTGFTVHFECYEFTSVCPKTGHPDFGTIEIEYEPNKLCLEMKALKLYLQSYRNVGAFYEDLFNRITQALVTACKPTWLALTGRCTARGGMKATVQVEHFDESQIRASE